MRLHLLQRGRGEHGVGGEARHDGRAGELCGAQPEVDEAVAGAVAREVEVVLVEADAKALLQLGPLAGGS